MQSHNSDLASVERRLRSIVTHFLDSNDASIKSADLEIDPSLPRYVCAECAFSTTKSNGLASHFRAQHILRPSFPCRWGRCTIRCVSQEAIDRHRRANHGIPCPQGDCGKVFMSTIELHHHLGESHTLKNPSTIFECPYPSCGQGFPHHNALLGHYDDRHPPYIYQDGKKAPYKCPFCAKRYIKERYMTPHVRSHLANRWAPNDQGDVEQDQGALIRQSQVATAEKASQLPEEPHIELQEPPEDYKPPPDGEEDYTVIIDTKGRIYIDDELILSSPRFGHGSSSSGQSSPEVKVSMEPNERMEIGYILGPQPIDTSMLDPEDGEGEYPEAFALDDDELPQRASYPLKKYSSASEFPDIDQGRKIFSWILHILGLGEWICVSEIMDLWTFLLEPGQRTQILQQFYDIQVEEDEDQILSILRSSTISELIHKWASFKLAAFQRFSNGVPRAVSAKTTICTLLQYCATLEQLVDEGRLTARKQGFPVPDLVRRPPQDHLDVNMDASMTYLIEALAERVKCRMVHQRWVQFTNVLVLKEIGAYMLDLKTVLRALYPFALHGQEWYHTYSLDRD